MKNKFLSSRCPRCNEPGAYIGGGPQNVECANDKCKLFSERQHKEYTDSLAYDKWNVYSGNDSFDYITGSVQYEFPLINGESEWDDEDTKPLPGLKLDP